jgi:hypothetical protein
MAPPQFELARGAHYREVLHINGVMLRKIAVESSLINGRAVERLSRVCVRLSLEPRGQVGTTFG